MHRTALLTALALSAALAACGQSVGADAAMDDTVLRDASSPSDIALDQGPSDAARTCNGSPASIEHQPCATGESCAADICATDPCSADCYHYQCVNGGLLSTEQAYCHDPACWGGADASPCMH